MDNNFLKIVGFLDEVMNNAERVMSLVYWGKELPTCRNWDSELVKKGDLGKKEVNS